MGKLHNFNNNKNIIVRGEEMVRVRAQVMIRDDSTGGWIPMGSGGLSKITVNKIELNPKPEENTGKQSSEGGSDNESELEEEGSTPSDDWTDTDEDIDSDEMETDPEPTKPGEEEPKPMEDGSETAEEDSKPMEDGSKPAEQEPNSTDEECKPMKEEPPKPIMVQPKPRIGPKPTLEPIIEEPKSCMPKLVTEEFKIVIRDPNPVVEVHRPRIFAPKLLTSDEMKPKDKVFKPIEKESKTQTKGFKFADEASKAKSDKKMQVRVRRSMTIEERYRNSEKRFRRRVRCELCKCRCKGARYVNNPSLMIRDTPEEINYKPGHQVTRNRIIAEKIAMEDARIARERAAARAGNEMTVRLTDKGARLIGGKIETIDEGIEEEGDDGPKPTHDYIIYGTRLADDDVILSCTIYKDFVYNRVMPTFHHWRSGNQKFGLTFQTAADGRAFHKGLRTALNELLSVLDPSAIKPEDDNDDELYLAFAVRDPPPPEPRPPTPEPYIPEYLLPNHLQEQKIAFMQLTGLPEYCYDDLQRKGTGTAPLKKRRHIELSRKPVSKFGAVRKTTRLRCRYCQELFEEEDNVRGACNYAPDCFKSTIDELSCIRCARCMSYHCVTDPDGDYPQHPCDCTKDENCTPRWLGLGLLSICAPCLCLYPPLKTCYWCGVQCGCCGGRHRVSN